MTSWHRWLYVEDMITLYEGNGNIFKKQLCKNLVIEITSTSLLQMVVAFPSGENCRSLLRSDGFTFGDLDGVNYN